MGGRDKCNYGFFVIAGMSVSQSVRVYVGALAV